MADSKVLEARREDLGLLDRHARLDGVTADAPLTLVGPGRGRRRKVAVESDVFLQREVVHVRVDVGVGLVVVVVILILILIVVVLGEQLGVLGRQLGGGAFGVLQRDEVGRLLGLVLVEVLLVGALPQLCPGTVSTRESLRGRR